MENTRKVFVLFGFFVASAGAADRVLVEATLPFDMTKDALCFQNGDPDLAKTGIPILGPMGVKKGVCQGIAGIAAAFRENVEFVPNAPADPAKSVVNNIDRAVSANRGGTREKVQIRGYSSLVDLCRANRMAFLRKAVWLNLDIAVDDIVPLYPQFNRLKKTALSTQKNPEALRHQLADALASTLSELREGHYPLVLFFSHVVDVRAYRELEAGDGSHRIELEIYDSNHLDATRVLTVPLAADGLPSAESYMLWVLNHDAASR